MTQQRRDPYIDILKGIGIISVVIGHSGTFLPGVSFPTTKFVYLYHLMIFFFTAGMVYKPEKSTDPFQYLGKQLKGSIPLYVKYNIIFLLFHNIFVRIHMLGEGIYGINNYIINVISILLMSHSETFGGALWFIPMFLFAKGVFGVTFQLAQKARRPHAVHLCFIIVLAFIGLYTNYFGMYLLYHVQTSLLGVPVIYAGYFFGKYRKSFSKATHPAAILPYGGILVLISLLNIGQIELSANMIINPALFYPVTFVGIGFCLATAQLLQKWHISRYLFSYAGRKSYHIMASHFLIIKLVDLALGTISNKEPSVLSQFPYSFHGLGWLYTLLGVGIPLVFCLIYDHRQKSLRNRSHFSPHVAQ